jgi:tetratricopeptide (TPR) repeat protein
MEGAFDEGRRLIGESHAELVELGMPHTVSADLISVADIEVIAGDLGAAEPILRRCLAEVEALGARFSAANAAWRLAHVLVQTGRDDEAEQLLARTADVEAGEYVDVWRHALAATIAARRGDALSADDALRAAEARMIGVDGIGLLADALLQLADACELLGRPADAVGYLDRAARIAHELGYLVCEGRALERLDALRSTSGR